MLNKVILIGRIVADPEVRYSQPTNTAIARYRLAVDRKYKREGEPDADFINCLCFGKSAEFVEKYLKKGTKIAVTGCIQTGSYKNKDGNMVYTTDIVVEEHEFCESNRNNVEPKASASYGFMNIPDGLDEELPFN